MSSTIYFTPLHEPSSSTIQPHRCHPETGVIVRDPEGLQNEIPNTLAEKMDIGEFIDEDSYPKKQYELLFGFTSYGRNDDDYVNVEHHNIANIGQDDVIDIFEKVSLYTDSFMVWFTDSQSTWPHAAKVGSEMMPTTIFELHAIDGVVSVTELELGVVSKTQYYETGESH